MDSLISEKKMYALTYNSLTDTKQIYPHKRPGEQ